MYNVNLKLPSKGAKLIAVVMALLCCVTAFGTASFAATSVQTVELGADGGEARLVMDFPQAAAEEIASMQISLIVTPSSVSADIEFVPDSGLPAKIVESRYNSDTDVLTVYLAGTRALFSDASPLTVGSIRIGGSGVSAEVSVKEGSIKFVRGSELVTPSGDVIYPSSVTISTGGAFIPISPSASSSTSSVPSSKPSSSASSSSGSSSSASSSDITEPSIPVEPADTSSLADAVGRADGYKRVDYTEDSYNTLIEALNRAKSVLSDMGASQDDIDEALLVLENAIGMLTPANNTPSGTDGYGGNNSSPVSNGGDISSPSSNNGNNLGSSGGSSVVSPEKTSDSRGSDSGGQTVGQNTSDSSQVFDTSKSENTENEKSDNSTVMWIIIVMAVLAVTAAALFAALKLKKK